MTYHGHVINGKIVLFDAGVLPEGAKVVVELESRVRPRHDPFGITKGLGPEITEEDIAEARREMWGNFPRDDFWWHCPTNGMGYTYDS